MKKITIEIETVNAAFEDYNDGFTETAHLLEAIASEMVAGNYPTCHGYTLHDSNGNVCGKVTIE